MLLAIDIGNTNMVIGIFQDKNLIISWRLVTDVRRTTDEYGVIFTNLLNQAQRPIDKKEINAAIIASVVPNLTPVLGEVCEKYFQKKAIIVTPNLVKMRVLYDHPAEVGIDRIVNTYAAWRLYRKDSHSMIIVDYGTATTFDVMSKNGEYLGGAIAPGIGISSEALFQKTAKLPRVELINPARCLGKNTVESMQAGLSYGFLGQTKEILAKLKKEVGDQPVVLGTGGLVNFIQNIEKLFDQVDQNLTLAGLCLIYKNSQ